MVEENAEGMRASDSDRDEVAERLRTALNEGRLTVAEYDERLQRAYAAAMLDELRPLTSDLPVPQLSAEVVARDEHKAKVSKEWRDWAGGAVIMIAIWGVTSAVSGDLKFFWPAIPIVIWAAIAVAMTIEGPRKGRGGC